MMTQNQSPGRNLFQRKHSLVVGLIAVLLWGGVVGKVSAQNSSLGIRMVPVTLILPQLQLTAPLGSTNALEVSTNLTTWQDVTTLVFTSTNMLWVDIYPRGSAAYYRMRRIAPGSLPPFPPPRADLVWIPPGQFVMGSPESDPDFLSEEQPQTTVTLTKGFFIGKYEVTQGEYLAVTGTNPSAFTGDTNLPVEKVSWPAATNFCRLLNIQEAGAGRLPAGYAYRLPAEAEWEYAARAGSTNRFSWGDDLGFTALTNYAWYTVNSGGGTHVVGQKLPNAWGLYDTAGNVCEWCLDSFGFYPGGSVTDPVPSMSGLTKVFRGGSHADEDVSCRAADRKSISQAGGAPVVLDIFGLRVVLAPTGP